MNESTHPVRLETKTQSGSLVVGAECKLSNDYGNIAGKSGDVLQVRRSSKDLDITCTHPANPDATARAISRANAGMWGDIILGGGIGAIIDHNKGTAYTYPTWIQLVFGKLSVFDRKDEKEGAPVQPVTDTPASAGAAPAAAAAPSASALPAGAGAKPVPGASTPSADSPK
jgi:hypothetical protein